MWKKKKKNIKTWFLYLLSWKRHIEISVFVLWNVCFVQFCKHWCFHDRVLNNYNVHATRNYVFMTLKTHKKPKKNAIFRIHVSYQKTLVKTDVYSERIFWFCTLNEHILLVKRDSETCRFLTKVLSRACTRVS